MGSLALRAPPRRAHHAASAVTLPQKTKQPRRARHAPASRLPARQTVVAGPRPNNTASVAAALSALLTSLGIPNTISALRTSLGGGGNAGIAARLVEYFFWGTVEPPVVPCVSCTKACRRPHAVRVEMDRVVAATEALVRAMDAALRRHKNVSLVQYIHGYITGLINRELKQQRVPVLHHIGIRPIFRLGTLMRFKAMRGIRMKVMAWVLSTYVDTYLPPAVKYNLGQINAKVFAEYRPQMMAFLTGRDEDLAPVAGFMVRHLLHVNKVKLGVDVPSVGCVLCKNAPFSCKRAPRRYEPRGP